MIQHWDVNREGSQTNYIQVSNHIFTSIFINDFHVAIYNSAVNYIRRRQWSRLVQFLLIIKKWSMTICRCFEMDCSDSEAQNILKCCWWFVARRWPRRGSTTVLMFVTRTSGRVGDDQRKGAEIQVACGFQVHRLGRSVNEFSRQCKWGHHAVESFCVMEGVPVKSVLRIRADIP